MIDREVSVQAAQNRAANIIEQARQEAANITAEADGYVVDVLSKLEQQLSRLLVEVHNGIQVVNNSPSRVPNPQPPPAEVEFYPAAPAPPQPVEVARPGEEKDDEDK
jgi:hypothetical protein